MNQFDTVSFRAFELARRIGYLSERECLALQVACWSLPADAVAVNIGAGAGTTALAIKEARPGWKLTTVDIDPGSAYGGLQNERNAFHEFGWDALLPNQILGDSGKVRWDGPAIDFILIDADHTERGLLADMENWLPHMRIGGFVVFHDYHRTEWPDVAGLVDGYVASGQAEFVFVVDTLAVVRVINEWECKPIETE